MEGKKSFKKSVDEILSKRNFMHQVSAAIVGVGFMIYCKKCRDGSFIEYEETLNSKSST